MTLFVDQLRLEGISVPTFGIGSTPSCSCMPELVSMLTEVHPGNCLL